MVNYIEIKQLPRLERGIHPGLSMPVQDENGRSDGGARKIRLSDLLEWLGKADAGGGDGGVCACRTGLRMAGAISTCTGQDFLSGPAFEWFYSLSQIGSWDPDAAREALGPDGQPPAGQFDALFWAGEGAGYQKREYKPGIGDIWYNAENETLWIWIDSRWVRLGGAEEGNWLPNETANALSTGVTDSAMIAAKDSAIIDMSGNALIYFGSKTRLASKNTHYPALPSKGAVSGLQGEIGETGQGGSLTMYCRVYRLAGNLDINRVAHYIYENTLPGDEFTFYSSDNAYQLSYRQSDDEEKTEEVSPSNPVKLMLTDKETTPGGNFLFRFAKLTGSPVQTGNWLPNETANALSTGVTDSAMIAAKDSAIIDMSGGAKINMANMAHLNIEDSAGIGMSGMARLIMQGGHIGMEGNVILGMDNDGILIWNSNAKIHFAGNAKMEFGSGILRAYGKGAVSGLQGMIDKSGDINAYSRVYEINGNLDLTQPVTSYVLENFLEGDELNFYTIDCLSQTVTYRLPNGTLQTEHVSAYNPVKLMLVGKDTSARLLLFIKLSGGNGDKGEQGEMGPAADLSNVVKLNPNSTDGAYVSGSGIISSAIGSTVSNVVSGGNMERGRLFIDSAYRLGVVAIGGSSKTIQTLAVPPSGVLTLSINGNSSKASQTFSASGGAQTIDLAINSLDFSDGGSNSEVQRATINQNNQQVAISDNAAIVVLSVASGSGYSGPNLILNQNRYRMLTVTLDGGSQGAVNSTIVKIGSSGAQTTVNIATNQSALIIQAGSRLSYQQMSAS